MVKSFYVISWANNKRNGTLNIYRILPINDVYFSTMALHMYLHNMSVNLYLEQSGAWNDIDI